MKNKNIYRVIWISCIFLLLIVVLVSIMDYKINHEYEDENYLYFYKCDGNVCTSSVMDSSKELLSRYECRYEECPKYERNLYKDYVLLKESDNSYELYNYITGDVISAGYDNYNFINDDYIVVSREKKQGIITVKDEVIVNTIYDKIGVIDNNTLTGFNQEYIVALKGDKYGIISYKDGKVKEDFKYQESRLEELLVMISTM